MSHCRGVKSQLEEAGVGKVMEFKVNLQSETVCGERHDSDTNEAFRCFVETVNVPQQ